MTPPYRAFEQTRSLQRRACIVDHSLNLHFHFNARPETVENSNQPIEREAPEVRIADTGKIRGGDAGSRMRLAHRQAFAISANGRTRGCGVE
jgi:hypothetical protein